MKTFIVILALVGLVSGAQISEIDPGVRSLLGLEDTEFAASCDNKCLNNGNTCGQVATPTANGCGAAKGFSKWTPEKPLGYNFGPCCNDHDKNYGRCQTKATSDTTFKNCMYNVCGKIKSTISSAACKLIADAYYLAVSSANTACSAYKKAQNSWLSYKNKITKKGCSL